MSAVDTAWVIAWREVNSILHQRRMLIFAVGFGVIIPLLAGAGFVGVAVRLSSAIGLGTVGHLHASLHGSPAASMTHYRASVKAR